ncbi:recombinase family protein [Streptomyces albospinus]|uniref:recombinase family protein n=1 Tax=Streptomyces albospinus TaxID=285515 RepID=UPI001E38AF39|nr:recombinase family protein [Streptomyces albospinus]
MSKSRRAQELGLNRFLYDRAGPVTPGRHHRPPRPRPRRAGTFVGYGRVSTKGQLLDRPIHDLTEAGCIRIFAGNKSGKKAEREELRKALDHLREGDTLAGPLARPARPLHPLI